MLQEFRQNCDVLVAVGQCAIMGGLPVMRNAIMHSDDPLKDCPECEKSELTKLVSAAGFRLTGTGWYETDFKNKKSNEKSNEKPTSKSESTPKTSS